MSVDQALMNQLITDNIDTWTSTVKTKSTAGRGSSKKLELYGVKKLRELILELAVRGKLVPQDPNDEPASVLLERIAKEKAKLVKEKKINKPKTSVEISDDEKPFDIPEEWKWIRLNEYAQVFSGNAFKSGDFSSEFGAKTIKITNAGVGHLIETEEYLPEEFLTTYSQYRVVKNDLILALTRPYISDGLKVSMCPDSYHNSLLNQRVAAIRAYRNPEYAFFMLRSPYVLNTYKNRFSGSGLQPNLKMSDVTELVIPICSEQEQRRIVVKVDELMTLCDQLEQQTEASIKAHQVLVTTLLDTLTNSTNAEDLMQNWERIAEHFDILFTTTDSIDQLKQTILQLAVMGKLVPQDLNDEPATKLLERIAKEKEQLIKENKIKKQKALPPIADDEKPFELPNGWEWERIGTFGVVGTGATPSRSNPKYWDSPEHNWVSSGETAELFVGETKEKVSELAIKETNISVYPVGTLIVAMYGQGKTRGQITELTEPAGTNQACAAIQLIENNPSHKDFVKLYFRKSYEELRSNAAGGAQPNLNVGKVQSTVIAIPPLKEQQRINAKVDELLIVCELLKGRIKRSQTTQLQLTDAIVEQAV